MTLRALWLTAATAMVVLAGSPLTAEAQTEFLNAAPVKLPDHWYIVQAGTLLADAGKPLARQVSVFVKNDKIDSIRPGFLDASALTDVTPGQVEVIDLKDNFVMAGLIDAHVHLGTQSFPAALRAAREKVMSGATTGARRRRNSRVDLSAAGRYQPGIG